MLKKKTFGILILPIILLASCSNGVSSLSSSGTDSSSETSSEVIETNYLEVPQAPEYEKLDPLIFDEYKTFYFDSLAGNDVNSGINENSPKKTLKAIPDLIMTYGQHFPLRMLLKRGSIFEGNLILAGYQATPERPFILDAYGVGEARPIINGVGSDADITTNAIVWIQEENTRVSNLEITGPSSSRGIYVLPRKGGIYKNIVISNNYVHDVNWNWTHALSPDEVDPATIDQEAVTPAISVNRYRRLYGGIEVFTGTIDVLASLNTGPITFEGVYIENNHIENVSHVGINVYNLWVNRPGVGYGYNKYVPEDPFYQDFENGIGYFPNKNIVVRDNFTNCIGGDGIVVNGSIGVWMERNTSYKSSYLGRSGFYNGGIWVHNTINGYMLYNEAAYTYLVNGAGDGEGFDIDNACENVYFLYNYAHHNQGGGLLLCNNSSRLFLYNKAGELINYNQVEMVGDWKNNIVRNNVFVNNGLKTNKNRSAFITTARNVSHFTAENNTIIMDDITNQHIINCEDNVVSINHVYRNNIFYSAYPNARPIFANQTLVSPRFEGNLYFNIASGNALENQFVLSDDTKAIFDLNPLFEMPHNFDGYDQSMSFVPHISLVKHAQTLADQMKFDMAGAITLGIAYLGAFVK